MKLERALLCLGASAVALLLACARQETDDDAPAVAARTAVDESAELALDEPILPLSAPGAEDERLVALGKRLFHDTGLSRDRSVACSSCHDLGAGGDDGRAHSVGAGKRQGVINAPTVFNATLNVAQFWDGRADSLEAQIDGPLTDPLEMDSSWKLVEERLAADASYVRVFQDTLGTAPNRQGVERAIAAFERTLITVDAPFDLWLKGDKDALSAEQQEGYELFKAAGCIACHQGQNAGGNMYQRLGLFGDYFEDRGNVTKADYGRFNATGAESDRFVFRVPSLRNVALTGPYFHDGSAETLPDAVRVMAKYQLGKELSDAQITKLVAFLESLTGRVPKHAVGDDRGGS